MKTDKLLHILTKHQGGGKTTKKPVAKAKPAPKQVNPYKDINATAANIFRAAVPVPGNVSQMLAKQLFNDARMNNASLTDEQKIILWNTIQNAKKRSGAINGGTEYVDYGNQGYGTPDEFNSWFNRGSAGLAGTVYNSLMNPGFNLASTIGRGRYWTDEKDPDTIYYTDVYDWNPGESNFKGSNTYQQIRNYVRSTEDKNLNADKNENFRMQFKLSKADIDAINKKREQNSFLNQKFLDAGPKYQQEGGPTPSVIPYRKPITLGVPEVTKLTPAQEIAYQRYKQSLGDVGGDEDYDLRGFWKEEGFKGLTDSGKNGVHFTDKYKILNFDSPYREYNALSDESKYASEFDRRGQGYWVPIKEVPLDNRTENYGKGWQFRPYQKGGSLSRAQLGGSPLQQQLINQALGQNRTASSTTSVATKNLQQKAVAKDIAEYGSIEKAEQAKAAKQLAKTRTPQSDIKPVKVLDPNYEYYNPEQLEYRDDKTIAPQGSLRASIQNDLNAYNEFVSNSTSMLQNLSGPVRGVGAIGALASDVFVNGPIQSTINLANTAFGDRPIRGDKDFIGIFGDAFNALPVFSSMFKGARAFNEASKLASEATFSPTMGIMPGAMQEGLESSSRFLSQTPVTIPGGIKKGADDLIAGNLYDEGILRMDEAVMPITDIMLGHASIPADMVGVKFVKDALQADPVLKREIATIVRDLNKDYGLTLDFRTIDSMEELQKIKQSAIDFLQSSDPRAVNARGLFAEKLQQTDATAVRTDINTRHIKLDQLNKKKKDLGKELISLNRGDPKIAAIQDQITKINDQIRNTVQNPTEIIFPSGIKYEGRSQMTSKGPVADVRITSVKPEVQGQLKISGDEPNVFNHFLFVSGDLNYTQSELNRLRALPNPDQADLDKIARLEQKITDSLMASGEMFRVSTQNAPKGTVVTETSMSSDSYGMLWNMGKAAAKKKTPYKLLTPAEFSQYESLKDSWSYMLDGPTQVSMSEKLARGETAGIPLVLPYRSPNTMGYAAGVGKRAPDPTALGINTLQGQQLSSIDDVALAVNTQNNLFEKANKTFEYQLANGRISQEFHDANVIKWFEEPLNPKNSNLTTTAPKVSASELANLDPVARKRFAPVQVPNDTHLNSPIFIDRNSGGFTWEGMNAKDSPLAYKYLGIGTNPGDFATFNNNANYTYFQQAIPTFVKEWKKGGTVKAQKGLANFGYENRIPRETTSTVYTPPTGYSNPKVHPVSTWFEDLMLGAVPYLGDSVDFGRGTAALKEGDNAHAFVNYLGAAMPFVAGATLQSGYDALGDYLHDNYINKPRKSDVKKATGGPTPKKEAQMTDAQKKYFQLLINQKNKK